VTVVLCSWSGQSALPRAQHDYHHDRKVKPHAATAVIELLMMDGETPESCWAVNKRQDNKLEDCCIWLVIYLSCTMMHGLTNLKIFRLLSFYGIWVYQYIRFVNCNFKMNLLDMTWMKLSFSGAFIKFRKPNISFVCLSVRPHGMTRLHLGRHSWNVVFNP